MKNTQKAIIVGGGIGGLCSAARLLRNGYSVSIYEKQPTVGGRANRVTQDGYTFDTGPTLLMMTDVLYETFTYCGKNLDDYVTLKQLEPNYKVTYADKTTITVSSNIAQFSAQLQKIDPDAPSEFYKFFSELAKIYSVARPNFIARNFNSLGDFINVKSGSKLMQKRVLTNLWSYVGRYFKDEKLKQLFSFQSMYLGVSPYEAPAVYAMLPYMETGLGIWYPQGGMYAIVQALENLVVELGGKIYTNTPVAKILTKNNKAYGVTIASKKTIKADVVICNADIVFASQNLLSSNVKIGNGKKMPASYKQAGSAVLFYFGVNDTLPDMLHHNVYLCSDFKGNLQEILKDKVLPSDPSFYTYIPTKTDPDLAPKDRNVLYILVPSPNLDANLDWAVAASQLRKKILSQLKEVYNIDLADKIETEAVFTPQDFKERYNLHIGSAFGISHHFFQSGYFRPHNYSANTSGLYFVGAGTYPGGGVPMVTISAQLVVERILEDYKHSL